MNWTVFLLLMFVLSFVIAGVTLWLVDLRQKHLARRRRQQYLRTYVQMDEVANRAQREMWSRASLYHGWREWS